MSQLETFKLLNFFSFFFSFFSKDHKVKYLPHFCSNHHNFFQWFFLCEVRYVKYVCIYKFCKKEIFDLTTWRTSRTTSRWSLNQKDWAKTNFINTKLPEGSIYSGAFLRNMQKSSKWSHRNGKTYFLVNLSEKFTFLGPVTSILTFLQFSQKCNRVYRPFRSVCLLWKFL